LLKQAEKALLQGKGETRVKSDFIVAVHAMVYLTHLDTLVSSDELAKNICTNPVRVRKIMGRLKKMGLVDTKEGHVGGYCTQPGAEKTSLLEIADGLDISFVDTKWRSGTDEVNCCISKGMAAIFDHLYQEMDRACREQLRYVTIEDLTLEAVKNMQDQDQHCHGEQCHDCPAWDKFSEKYGR
jgi:DNA-binding IscR family transcriptional regulator